MPGPARNGRSGHAPSADLVERRCAIQAAVVSGYFRTEPRSVEMNIRGVRCLRFAPPGVPRGTVLHLHGGAFRMGCPEQVGPFAAQLAASAGVDVICPAYRLAPEHPFPAGLDDAFAVLGDLANGQVPLFLSGDSAGGGLAASLAARAAAHGLRLAGLVLLSPWLDLTVTNAAYRENARSDPLFSESSATEAAALYLQGMPASDPEASPLHGDVDRFPPTYINVGTGEVLSGDAQALVQRLRSADVRVTFHPINGMDHVAVTRGADLPGSAETLASLAAFIGDILSGEH